MGKVDLLQYGFIDKLLKGVTATVSD